MVVSPCRIEMLIMKGPSSNKVDSIKGPSDAGFYYVIFYKLNTYVSIK